MKKTKKVSARHCLSFMCGIVLSFATFFAIKNLSFTAKTDLSAETQKGLRYLTYAETKDPSPADIFFRNKRNEKLALEHSQMEREAFIESLTNGTTDVFSLFKDYIILGDSRAFGFAHFKLLSISRVWAEGGDTILTVKKHMGRIQNINPTYIYLCYGINDVGIGEWETPEDYANEVLSVVNEIHEAVPDAKIYYNSIISISEEATGYELLSKIYDFSDACKEMCAENGIGYIDNSEICEQLKRNNWWAGDGIHLSEPFYRLWGINLYTATLEEPQI